MVVARGRRYPSARPGSLSRPRAQRLHVHGTNLRLDQGTAFSMCPCRPFDPHGAISRRSFEIAADAHAGCEEDRVATGVEPMAITRSTASDIWPAALSRRRSARGVPLAQFRPSDMFAEICSVAEAMTGELPNIDFALAALADAYALPADSPFIIFALGRVVGWIAHSLEQIETGRLIRPRAQYIGPKLKK